MGEKQPSLPNLFLRMIRYPGLMTAYVLKDSGRKIKCQTIMWKLIGLSSTLVDALDCQYVALTQPLCIAR